MTWLVNSQIQKLVNMPAFWTNRKLLWFLNHLEKIPSHEGAARSKQSDDSCTNQTPFSPWVLRAAAFATTPLPRHPPAPLRKTAALRTPPIPARLRQFKPVPLRSIPAPPGEARHRPALPCLPRRSLAKAAATGENSSCVRPGTALSLSRTLPPPFYFHFVGKFTVSGRPSVLDCNRIPYHGAKDFVPIFWPFLRQDKAQQLFQIDWKLDVLWLSRLVRYSVAKKHAGLKGVFKAQNQR